MPNDTERMIAGALVDFLAWMTTRPESVPIGAAEDASRPFELLQEWAMIRGLLLDDAAVLQWQNALTKAKTQE